MRLPACRFAKSDSSWPKLLPDSTRVARNYPSDGQAHYSLGPSAFQRARARIQRRARRQYIIYQQNTQIVNLRPFSDGVGATDRLPVLRTRENKLGWARLRPNQHPTQESPSQALGERLSDKLRLVITALPLPICVQRNGNNRIELRSGGSSQRFRQPRRKPIAQSGHLLVL